MQCYHAALNRIDTEEYVYRCAGCGAICFAVWDPPAVRDAPEKNSQGSNQPDWTGLINQILPLLAEAAGQSARSTEIAQLTEAVKTLTPLMKWTPLRATVLTLTARLEQLLLAASPPAEKTPVPQTPQSS